MNVPQLQLIELKSTLSPDSIIWTSDRHKKIADEIFKDQKKCFFPDIPKETDSIVVLGGGALIDFAKHWKFTNNINSTLIAIPTIWGSGAENSPVAVLNTATEKQAILNDLVLPNYRCYLPEITNSLSMEQKKDGCGDALSHLFEAFLSPITTEPLRQEISEYIHSIDLENHLNTIDEAWFQISANACAFQAKSAVGLIHGMAHILEPILKQSNIFFGHAHLCRILLFPVFSFNAQKSEKFTLYFENYNHKPETILSMSKQLFELNSFDLITPYIVDNWTAIQKHPLSRINSASLKKNDYNFFKEFTGKLG